MPHQQRFAHIRVIDNYNPAFRRTQKSRSPHRRYQKTFELQYSSGSASGFLLVSLSKAPRRTSSPFIRILTEALPMKANDKRLSIGTEIGLYRNMRPSSGAY